MKYQTTTFKGKNILQSAKTKQMVNFATEKNAQKRADILTKQFGQKVSVCPHVHEGKTLWFFLEAEAAIL
jgi:hypothetical protein